MVGDGERVDEIRNIGLFTTFKCQVACAHCSVRAGPHRTEVLDEGDAADWMSQAAEYQGYRIRAINFTGGEPFFDLPALRRLVGLAVQRGLIPTAVTNAHWATTAHAALETLRSIPDLLLLQISADEHHQEVIPFDRVRHAVTAARELGLVYQVAVCTEDETSPDHRRTMDRLLAVTDAEHVRTVITHPAGRAADRLHRLAYRSATALPRLACGVAGTPLVFPDGRVLGCGGPLWDVPGAHPLLLGDLRRERLEDILDRAQTNFALQFLRVWGPVALAERLEAAGFPCGLSDRHIVGDLCGFCSQLMSRQGLGDALEALAGEGDLLEKLAWARAYHLEEDEMVRRLGLLEQTGA